jgi:hypothetical protein
VRIEFKLRLICDWDKKLSFGKIEIGTKLLVLFLGGIGTKNQDT